MKVKVLAILLFLALIFMPCDVVFAEEKDFEGILSEMTDGLEGEQLNGLLEEIFTSLGFGGKTFKDKLLYIINGDFSLNSKNILQVVCESVLSSVKDLLPTLGFLSGIFLAYALVKSFKPRFLEKGVDKVVRYSVVCLTVTVVLRKTFEVFNQSIGVIDNLSSQMNVVFPLIITVMAFTGAKTSVGMFTPAVSFLSVGIIGVFKSFVFPLIYSSAILITISSLSEIIKTDKIVKFASSVNKWIIGITVTVFTFFITVKGFGVSYNDGISLRVAKYAIASSVPIVGGFLRDGTEVVLASGVLIKNAIGTCGLLIIASVLTIPVIKITLYSLFLKLAAAIADSLGDEKSGEYLLKISYTVSLATACVIIIAFLYLITVATVIFTGGAFV